MLDYSLYLCTNSDINHKYKIEECVEQAILGGVTFVQVREKSKTEEELFEEATRIKNITDKHKIPLVINDNVDIAVRINADGVHIGQDDMTCEEARKKIGANKIIGVSVRTLEEAKKAINDGADYLGVGAIYKSQTKKDACVVGINELQKIVEYSNIPIVVIGGINENTIGNLKGINIDGYAMIRPILDTDNIVEHTKKLKDLVLNNKKYI